jgi:hypothetical protein
MYMPQADRIARYPGSVSVCRHLARNSSTVKAPSLYDMSPRCKNRSGCSAAAISSEV